MTDGRDFTMNTNLHRAFAREVQRLRRAVQSADLADPKTTAGLLRRFEFFSATLHNHHEGEDEYLFGKVRERATPAEVVVLNAMDAEHACLKRALAALEVDFQSLGPTSDPKQIAADFDELQTVLNGHATHEEHAGVPIVQKYLTDDDFRQFMRHTRTNPYSTMVLAWACDGATPKQVESTWSMLPGFVRLFLKPISTRQYRSFTAECGV